MTHLNRIIIIFKLLKYNLLFYAFYNNLKTACVVELTLGKLQGNS